MDSTLVIVALVSLALASAMSLVAWRMVTLERRRESARVAALVDLAREDDDLLPGPGPERPGAPRDMTAKPVASGSFLNVEGGASQPSPEDASSDLFATRERESPAGLRFVAIVAVAAVMAVAVGALMLAGVEPRASLKAEPSASGTAMADPSAVGTTGVPLELVSLRHERDGERLTITGLVLNPRHGARVERASAVVFVFDPAGTFVASGRALVDFTKLDPGDESPFVVTVIAPGKVGRYRIGFRGQDGAVVGHVDRREGT
ncbi:MAG: hypothetical protein ACRD1S_13850 [Vicinamibacterales bacterium]